ncbi:MAG: hypothetical protein HW410_908 [Nitrosarchaeum sp.]|nr:hypothetical protein [Nitrosarchaeum sp.]
MEHVLFSDGNTKKIGWMIQTNDLVLEQKREHPGIYLDKVSNQQSKYIALHVGLFWSIGTFIIKNQDTVRLVLDDKIMLEHLSGNKKSPDKFIEKRKFFIRQLIEQRKLKIQYELLTQDKTWLLKK